MTLEEKAQQLTSVLPNQLKTPDGIDEGQLEELLGAGIGQISAASLGSFSAAEVARLNNDVQRFLREKTRIGIPAVLHNEALNGVLAPSFTSFPTAIGLASTWDTEKVREMTTLIRHQSRALGIRQALAPVLDIARDARWGRIHETFGEEVLLTSALGAAYVAGMQGDDPRTGLIATAKHFLGYATSEGGQNTAAVHAGPRELYDVYATPFEAAIRVAGLASVMNSYSEVDGVPAGLSRELLTDLLRDRMGFRGTVVADYRTIQYGVDRLGAAPEATRSAALALHAGLDVELPAPYGYGATLVDAVRSGLIAETDVDRSVSLVLEQKFALGLFEDPFVDDRPEVIETIAREGRGLAQELAEESITLLTNDGILPLTHTPQRVAVIGPHASNVIGTFANYTYPPMLEMIKGIADGKSRMAGLEGSRDELPPTLQDAFDQLVERMETFEPEQMVREMYNAVGFADALAAAAPHLDVATCEGSGVMQPIDAGLHEAAELARSADVVILAIGGRSGAFAGNATEGEGTDSATLELPDAQLALIDAVTSVGKPTAAVITMGRPYALAEISAKVSAIVASPYPGPAAGPALARIVTGDLAPSGKLPFTLPRAVGQVPIYQAQKRGSGYRRLAKDIFKGYLDLDSTPLHPFGHGLSYVDFEYDNLRIDKEEVGSEDTVGITATIRNLGERTATEIVQMYLGLPALGVTRPAQQLAGFARVPLEPGAGADVRFDVPVSMCGFSATATDFVVDPGEVDVLIGTSSSDIRLEGTFTITGVRTNIGATRSYFPDVAVRPASEPAEAAMVSTSLSASDMR
ncbi:glycoside hydrolase family 3 protein [Ruania alba]|nr:glycoside hydrolase family 3 N-terminal domain-containing protein [Ruania alba]